MWRVSWFGTNHNPSQTTCLGTMTLLFAFSHKLSALGISKSKEGKRILNFSTIKLGELSEDTTFTQRNHALLSLVKEVKKISSKPNALPSTHPVLCTAAFHSCAHQFYTQALLWRRESTITIRQYPSSFPYNTDLLKNPLDFSGDSAGKAISAPSTSGFGKFIKIGFFNLIPISSVYKESHRTA